MSSFKVRLRVPSGAGKKVSDDAGQAADAEAAADAGQAADAAEGAGAGAGEEAEMDEGTWSRATPR